MSEPPTTSSIREGDTASTATKEAMILGRALAVLRVSRGLTQKEVARSAGIRQVVLSKWETGRCMPSFASVQQVVRRLGLSLVALDRALQLVRDPMGREQLPLALSQALEPDLAQLPEMIGKAVAEWYLRVMHRDLVASDLPDRRYHPARAERPPTEPGKERL
jgi:transcriptional regulator with XRE-family HTH domain